MPSAPAWLKMPSKATFFQSLYFKNNTVWVVQCGIAFLKSVKSSTCSVQWQFPQNPHPLLCSESSGPKPTISPLPFIWWWCEENSWKPWEKHGPIQFSFFLCSRRYGLFKKKKNFFKVKNYYWTRTFFLSVQKEQRRETGKFGGKWKLTVIS